MWSFNRDGEADKALLRNLDGGMKLGIERKRWERSDLAGKARPQRGVDELKDVFPDANGTPPGVREAGDGRG